MPSCPTASASASTTPTRPTRPTRPDLFELLKTIRDHRGAQGRRFPLASILVLAFSAVMTGARSFIAMGEFAHAQTSDMLRSVGITQASPPEESTFRRVFAGLDADHLDQVLGAHLWTATSVDDTGRRVIAVDGKTVRGARTRDKRAPHLVAALDHTTGTVLGQLAITAKSNEIPAVRTLLATFDLTGTVVTVDAMHTQNDTAELITTAGGDYVFTIKNNRPTLYAACKNLPWSKVPNHRSTETGHGRRITRTIAVLTVPDWIDFPGAVQIAQIRRTVTKAGKKTVEVVYVVTSADHVAASPAVLAGWVQAHWGIENRLHWVRDVSFDEDRSQVRTGAAPQVMATLRNTVISLLRLNGWLNIAAGLRHHARTPGSAVTLVLTC